MGFPPLASYSLKSLSLFIEYLCSWSSLVFSWLISWSSLPLPSWTNPVCWPCSIYYSPCSGPFQMPLVALSLIIYSKNFLFNHTLEQFPLIYTSDSETLKQHLGSGSMESSWRLKSQSGWLSGFFFFFLVNVHVYKKHVRARGEPYVLL